MFPQEEGEREIRVICADPGAIASNIYVSAFTNWAFVRAAFQFFYSFAFHLVRSAVSSLSNAHCP